jgi:hypothetical protein
MTTSNKTVKVQRPMTDEEIEHVARTDLDAQAFTEADGKHMKRIPQTKIIRCALGELVPTSSGSISSLELYHAPA